MGVEGITLILLPALDDPPISSNISSFINSFLTPQGSADTAKTTSEARSDETHFMLLLSVAKDLKIYCLILLAAHSELSAESCECTRKSRMIFIFCQQKSEKMKKCFSPLLASLVVLAVSALPWGVRKELINEEMFDEIGGSSRAGRRMSVIPSTPIRLPSWVENRADPRAKWYLYFSSHGGDSCHMAWSRKVDGPYTLYRESSAYDMETDFKGVLGGWDYGSRQGVRVRDVEYTSLGVCHVLSLNRANDRFIMHAMGKYVYVGGDSTKFVSFVATSEDGLNFNPQEDSGSMYKHGPHPVVVTTGDVTMPFRSGTTWFGYDGDDFSFYRPNEGDLTMNDFPAPGPFDQDSFLASNADNWLNSPTWSHAIVTPSSSQQLSNGSQRHVYSTIVDEYLYILGSRIGDTPERILYASVYVGGAAEVEDNLIAAFDGPNPPRWREFARPVLEFEGVNHELRASTSGGDINVHEMREPLLYDAANKGLRVLYSASGEEAIGTMTAMVAAPGTLCVVPHESPFPAGSTYAGMGLEFVGCAPFEDAGVAVQNVHEMGEEAEVCFEDVNSVLTGVLERSLYSEGTRVTDDDTVRLKLSAVDTNSGNEIDSADLGDLDSTGRFFGLSVSSADHPNVDCVKWTVTETVDASTGEEGLVGFVNLYTTGP